MSKWQLQCGVTATGAILAGLGALLPSREQTLILLIHLCNLEDWIVEIIKDFWQTRWSLNINWKIMKEVICYKH